MIRTTFLLIFTVILTQIAVSQTDNDTIANTSFRQEIKSLDFNQGAIADPMQLIQGHAPGVTISKRGSDPTVFNNLLIRGVSSYYKTNPLYVIDGIWDADPSLINPSDIELFEILKDAAETSHYGSRGANGVIIIKTKTYKGDKPFSVDFDSWLSLNTQSKKLDLLTVDQYRAFVSRVDQYNQFIDGGASTDWQKEFFQNSVSHNVSLAAQGKIQNTTYRFGFWQTTNNGLIPESNVVTWA
ncbi:MAG TPA: TonB-dependent receptor plug domain-containing protein [Salinivirgaceae bacterium]|nr:TonB-dependent receptor plug domain-containing protein [Salinivirgaceae bacterium]